MIRSTKQFPLAVMAVAALASSSFANYVEVFTEAQVAGGVASSFLDTTAVSGGVAYAVSRDTTGADTGALVSYDGTTFTTIMSPADWTTFGSTQDIGAFNGANVVGNVFRAVNFFDNNIYDIDLGTGTVTEFVSAADFDAATGGTANISASNLILPDGSAIVYDSVSDTVLQVSSAGAISTLISDTQLTALVGSDVLAGTGFALVGDDVYFGSNIGDSLYKWTRATSTGEVVFDTAQLEALSDDIDGNAGIDDVYLAPDGLVYFYEDDADYIYSFDAADPSGTLAIVATEEYLNDGPGSDGVGQFAWWNGNIAWTDQSDGFYAIPEPTTALLAALAIVGACARRR